MLLKSNISLSLTSNLLKQIDNIKLRYNLSRSEVVEELIKESLEKKLIADATELSKIAFDDLPDESEWNTLQSN